MLEFFSKLFDSEFMPHGHCYLWSPSILWIHVISDFVIAVAYYSIPISLYIFARKRSDFVFGWVLLLFAAFILACGTTHILEIWNVWHGNYRVSGLVKAITAVLSIGTALVIRPLIPKLLALPSPKQLEDAATELSAEISQRKIVEQEMLILNKELEEKIRVATGDLQVAIAQKDELLFKERQTRIEAEKAIRLKDDFLSNLSHELRTPLNGISTWVQLLATTRSGNPVTSEAVPILEKSVKDLSHIIDDLLDMSAILTGTLITTAAPYDVIEIVRSLLHNLKTSTEVKNITVETHFQENLPQLRGDEKRIRQIVWNLLTNAIKFSAAGKKVTVSVGVENSSVFVRVKDDGHGISAAFLPHVFDRFRQEVSSTTREFTGLGLGLSIAKQLAELHNGRITVTSDGIGSGSEFTLLLPVAV